MAVVHIIDMDKLIFSTTNRLNYHMSRSDVRKNKIEQFLIHKVDDHISNKKTYEPEIVSIGPYHHGTPALGAMQKEKWNYLDYILNLNHENKLSLLIEAMKEIEEKVKACYADAINMDKNQFRKMLIIDGCFILRLLHSLDGRIPPKTKSNDCANIESIQNNSENENSQEISFAKEHLYNNILSRDLLLFDNQIPFVVVKKIHEIVTDGSIPSEVLVKNIIEWMEDVIGCYPIALQELERPKEFHHLLHLCHMYFRPNKQNFQICKNNVIFRSFRHYFPFGNRDFFKRDIFCDYEFQGSQGGQSFSWRRASEYHQAGVEFKKKELSSDNPHSLLDIEFCNDIMKIPGLTIDPNTYSLFKNLIVFEQTCPHSGNYVTAYIVFLSYFISMPDDVTLLTTRGIIEHQLNSDTDVSTFFRELCEGVIFDFNSDYYLKSLCHVMEAHYQSQKPRFREWLGTIASKISRKAGHNETQLIEMLPPEQYV